MTKYREILRLSNLGLSQQEMLGMITGPMFRLLVKKSKRDISNLKFCSKITIARVLRKANILLCFRNRIDQINFYDFHS